jgi:hypothetical protein
MTYRKILPEGAHGDPRLSDSAREARIFLRRAAQLADALQRPALRKAPDREDGAFSLSPARRVAAALSGAPLDCIKLAATVSMALDHANKILFHLDYPAFWFIGRLAFPLFAFAIAVHLARGAEPWPYVQRLVLIAAISQPIYAGAFGVYSANVICTLAAGATLAPLICAQKPLARHGAFALGVAAILAPWLRARSGLDYGLAGVLLPAALVACFEAGIAYAFWAALIIVGVSLYPPAPSSTIAGAIATTTLGGAAVIGLSLVFRGRKRFLPSYALYVFYPAHLGALFVIGRILLNN